MHTTTVVTLIAAAFLLCLTAKADTMGQMLITTDTVLTENHIGNVVLTADDITLDCTGHTITGPGIVGTAGVTNDTQNGNTVTNCHVIGFVRCFFVQIASDNLLTDNSATDCEVGFNLSNADRNILRNNTAIGNTGAGIGLSLSSNNRLMQNDIYQSFNIGIALVQSDSNKLIDNTVVHGTFGGIKIQESDKNSFTRNTVCGNDVNGTGSVDVALFADSFGNIFRNNNFCITAGF